jgi:hypothetical protein
VSDEPIDLTVHGRRALDQPGALWAELGKTVAHTLATTNAVTNEVRNGLCIDVVSRENQFPMYFE